MYFFMAYKNTSKVSVKKKLLNKFTGNHILKLKI